MRGCGYAAWLSNNRNPLLSNNVMKILFGQKYLNRCHLITSFNSHPHVSTKNQESAWKWLGEHMQFRYFRSGDGMPYIIFKGPTINGALHSLASATGRQKGTVRKSLDKQKWSARFQFQKDTTRVTMDGPPRAKRVDAEKDRQCVVVVMQQVELQVGVQVEAKLDAS